MIKLPTGKKALLLAFEFGLILSETAKSRKVKLNKEIVERAEAILIKELKTKGFKKTALNFVPLVLASFEK